MTRLGLLVPLFGLSAALAAACSNSDSTDHPGSGAGSGGEAAGGAAGESSIGGTSAGETTTAGAAGENAAGACNTDGTGKLTITVTGLPADVEADVLLGGADDLAVTKTETIPDATAGNYTVTASRVFDADKIVRTVFDATVTAADFCLSGGASHEVKVTYAPIPTSNKLWMPTAKDVELAGFSSAQIAASGSKVAEVGIDGPGSKSIAFDQDGNLWALGPTVADPMIVRFSAASLAASGKATPDIELNVPEIMCTPAISHIAFDGDGNLWLSACGDEIHKLAAADLTKSNDKVVSDVLIAGATNNEGIAFDKAGNLWVAGDNRLSRFDAARLGSSDSDPADLSLDVSVSVGNVKVGGTELAFDQAGNLWAVDVGLNFVFQIAEASLGQTGLDKAIKAEHAFHFDPTVTAAGIAFDEGSGLWMSLTPGNFGRFSPTQIAVNKGSGENVVPETVIKSSSIDSELPVAFFPAPSGLPLYHAIPMP